MCCSARAPTARDFDPASIWTILLAAGRRQRRFVYCRPLMRTPFDRSTDSRRRRGRQFSNALRRSSRKLRSPPTCSSSTSPDITTNARRPRYASSVRAIPDLAQRHAVPGNATCEDRQRTGCPRAGPCHRVQSSWAPEAKRQPWGCARRSRRRAHRGGRASIRPSPSRPNPAGPQPPSRWWTLRISVHRTRVGRRSWRGRSPRSTARTAGFHLPPVAESELCAFAATSGAAAMRRAWCYARSYATSPPRKDPDPIHLRGCSDRPGPQGGGAGPLRRRCVEAAPRGDEAHDARRARGLLKEFVRSGAPRTTVGG